MAVYGVSCVKHDLKIFFQAQCKIQFNFTNTIKSSIPLRPHLSFIGKGIRYLYSDQFLGLDKFAEQRKIVLNQFGDSKVKFQNRMENFMKSEVPSLVFTEDLKNILFLADDQPHDIDICLKMMKRFNQQNSEMRFGTFVFGPVAMRLFHYLKKPEMISQILNDKDLDGFFDQMKSFHVAMDLLYKHGFYQDVIETNECLQKRILEARFPRECVVLAMASCYKLNTPEAYKYATDLLKEAREAGAIVLRKALTFLIALALNQNEPHVAMEVLALTPQMNYITVKNLRLITLAELNRLDEVFSVLRSVNNRDVPVQAKNIAEISQSTLQAINKAIEKVRDKESAHIFEQLCRALKENNHITDETIDELLCSPIQSSPFVKGKERGFQIFSSPYSNPRRISKNPDLLSEASSRTRQKYRQGIYDLEE